ncbi:hypothetical protein MNV49_002714 [Pseudohyphozyma bogoriensis]|nr:hypothetical protein MNV49_002714 [Pseudohyphozyma bogoriensis]
MSPLPGDHGFLYFPRRAINEDLAIHKATLAPPPDSPDPDELPPVSLEDFESLASYNWLEREQPSIIVPGSPRIWSAPNLPFTLPPDAHQYYYIDQNGSRVPKFPLAPLFTALQVHAPDVDLAEFDIVTDRGNLTHLLTWLSGGNKQEFRVDIGAAGEKTVLFSRFTSRPKMIGAVNEGWGLGFEVTCTEEAGSLEGIKVESHHRIVAYSFLGLRLLVRFEVDACTSDDDAPPSPSGSTFSSSPSSNYSFSSSTSSTYTPSPTPLFGIHYQQLGTLASQSSLVELKTGKKAFSGTAVYPQAFFSQTPFIKRGRRTEGTFWAINEYPLDGMQAQERNSRERMRKLRGVLEEVRKVAMEGRDDLLSLWCREGRLEVWARTGGVVTPMEVEELFER